MQIISITVSLIALCASLFTLWFTILRRGSVLITRPSLVAFTYELVGGKIPQAKIFLRTLLFSTGKRGWVVESLFLRVSEGGRCEEFSFWGHGDKDIVRGSGIFAPENGIVTNHHFTPLHMDRIFEFPKGVYTLELFVKLVNRTRALPLWTENLEILEDTLGTANCNNAIFFNWSPEKNKYIAVTR